MTTIKFEIGETYKTRSICDYNCIFAETIIRRTEKTVWNEKGKGFRVAIHNDIETIMPYGRYSMAPMLSADRKTV